MRGMRDLQKVEPVGQGNVGIAVQRLPDEEGDLVRVLAGCGHANGSWP